MTETNSQDPQAASPPDPPTFHAGIPAAHGGRVSPPGTLGSWLRQGLRTAFLLRADWSGLRLTPSILALLFLVPVVLAVLGERFYIEGPARFYWQSLAGGWIGTVLVVWACWLLVRGRQAESGPLPYDAASLFAMTCAQRLPLVVVASLVFVPMTRYSQFFDDTTSVWLWRALWAITAAWLFAAPALLLARAGPARWWARGLAMLVVASGLAVSITVPLQHWYPAPSANGDEEGESQRFKLTQAVMEQQAEARERSLQSLEPQRAGIIDVYALTFAPYATEDVFRRESSMVAEVMKARFDTDGRTLELVNHRATASQLPWATPLNLQRAIARVATMMDRDEDILFIHLTSHGARDGTLSAWFWPLEIDAVTATMLKAWLDEAGVKNRVISVSACFSGTWVPPLADAQTLVMTASDSEHTSYGCGRRSELTFFGRAMYDEGMRKTWSFEEAHAAARTVIEQREKDAGKADGYSNPQIAVGDRIRERLRVLATQRAAAAH